MQKSTNFSYSGDLEKDTAFSVTKGFLPSLIINVVSVVILLMAGCTQRDIPMFFHYSN
jgi:hypothetical protein